MFSEAHRQKNHQNDALAGNTQIEVSVVLQGLAVHTRSEGKVETMFTAAGGTAALSSANRSYMLANGYQMFLEIDGSVPVTGGVRDVQNPLGLRTRESGKKGQKDTTPFHAHSSILNTSDAESRFILLLPRCPS